MSKSFNRIEAILSEIEALDAATNGQFRQAEDREAFDIAARLERKMAPQFKRACKADGVEKSPSKQGAE